MKIFEFGSGKTRNHPVQEEPTHTTERNLGNKLPIVEESPSKFCSFFKKWRILISVVSALIIIGIILIIVLIPKKGKQKPEIIDNTISIPTTISESPGHPVIDMEETKKVFSPAFKVSSKVDELTQLSQKSFQTYESTNNGQSTSYIILNKVIYDIYTINSTSSSKNEEYLYNTKYTTLITVNSLCSKITSNPKEDDCQLEKQLDLNKRDESNLRRNEENPEDLIRRAILPMCFVEHTDTNLLLSLTCPETLNPSYKADIMRAFSNIKPASINGFDFDKNYVDTNIEDRDDKIYINSFDNVCMNPNEDPDKEIICNLTKNIITDNEGNLISSKISNSTKTITDENNSFSNNFTYEFKNVPKENSESFDEEAFKKNLETISSLTNSLMKKEVFIDSMTDFAVDLMSSNNVSNTDVLRYLKEVESVNPGVHEETIFTKNIHNISMDLNLKNDIGLNEDKTIEASSIHNVNKENYTELSLNKIQTSLYDILSQFSSLSKGANNNLKTLYDSLNEPLLNFMDIINENIEKINGALVNKDLSEIFDSTFAINELDSLPYNFVTATENLYNSMNSFGEELIYTIDTTRKKLKNSVSSFLSESHNLIFKIFSHLSELTDTLSTGGSRIVGISGYYLNNTYDSYYEIIQQAKNILDNYYKNEKELIFPLVKTMLDNFYTNTKNSIEKYQNTLDSISERLNDGNLIISLSESETEPYQKSISNIYNTKNKANEIIETVKQKFMESINLQSNGYFETQKEIEDNSNSYGPKGESALSKANDLDNNELIDKVFDGIMTSFRDKFIEILKYMENSINEKFYLEENVLSTNLFDSVFLNEIDEYFKTEKINVLNFIKTENDEYLKKVNEHLNGFKTTDGKSLEQIISELMEEMTDIYLDNLNSAYSDSLDNTFNKINEIIDNNKKLGEQYLSNVKNADSFHITTGFVKKYNIYINSIQAIIDFINNKLKINLSNKYKNVITQIRSLLQSIKSNSVLEKYYKQLPLAEQHLNSIKDLFEIFNRHISDNTYNMKFLPLINNYIKSTNDKLNNIKNSFTKINNEMAKKDSYDLGKDYDKKRIVKGSRYCCKRFLGICVRHCYHPDVTYYDGYNVEGTNNHNNLTEIHFEDYIKDFDGKFNQLYPQFSKNVFSYNSLLSNLDNEIEKEAQKDSFNEKIDYLDNISNKVQSVIDEKLGDNLLNASYNYYKNKIINNLQNELDGITQQWTNAYDQVYNDINTNKDNFKSSVYEFVYIASFYVQVYNQNISYGYGDSIVEKLKHEFNYTNRYYYNLIISKLNNTYAYILNNLPINEKPFDKILNKRISEIKESYNNLLTELQNSRDEILDKTKQEIVLQVNSKNFFYINDIIRNHIKAFNNTLTAKVTNIASVVYQIIKEYPEELIAAKFYLENSINGKQIKDNYDSINKATFVDLQTSVYQNLIDDIWKIDRDELIKNIINALSKLNETNNNNFKYENEKYVEILQNKLYSEFYTKENLIEKINSLFLKGITNCKENPPKQIDAILTSVLTQVTNNIKNEATRLNNELTSYSNVFTTIKNRLNNYKTSIYEQFYSTITYVDNDFNEQILEKFYKNFIEKGLNEYEKNIEETDFGTAQFLNMSIDLNAIINKEFNLLISDYKNLTLNQIQFLYQKNIQLLDQLFSFSKMKLKINNEIDNIYNTQLLPALKKVGTHNSGDDGVSDYDLPDSILKDIDDFIKEKISSVKNIMKAMEGEEFNINNFSPADFSAGKEGNVYQQIGAMFNNFTLTYTSQEKKEFEKVVGENALNNFKNLMNNFIPSFGVDFFDRILKFNEIQKIQLLYKNLKYSLAETIVYYIGMTSLHNSIHLPVDIKLKLFALNNLDSVVKVKNDLIISTLNQKLDNYFEETKNYITNKYINDMNTNEEFDMNFKTNVKDIIKGIVSGNLHNYENEYIDMMKENIKNPFIEEYTSVLNMATNEMKNYIENSKIELKAELDNVFSLDSDSVLADIQDKLNKTKKSVDEYNEHFSFKIPEEVMQYLDNFGNENLVPKYLPIKEILDKRTTELIIINLEKLSNEFKNEYSVESFKQEVNNVNKNLSTYFTKFESDLNNYGYIDDVYEKNLDKEMANNRRLRLLEEGNSIQKVSNVELNGTFNELKKTSSLIKDFTQSLNKFVNFEENIEKYINEKNKQYSFTIYNLEKNKDKNENYELMIEKLNELNQLSLEYYPQVQSIYDIMKEQLIEHIDKIYKLINSCEEVTYEILNKKYTEIKDDFNQINETKNSEKKEIDIAPYKTNQTDNYFTIETKVGNYLINNKFTLDYIFDEESKNSKIIGTVINNVNPKIFDIDFYSTTGQGGKLGRTINVVFNNISSYSNIVFDSAINQATIVTNFNFEEYTVKTQYYEERCESIQKNIMGMIIIIPGVKTRVDIDTPDNEKQNTIPAKNITLIEKYLY